MKHSYLKIKLSIIISIMFSMIAGVNATPTEKNLAKKYSEKSIHVETNNEEKPSISNEWERDGGIRVLSIRQTAAGYMLDFRYKVLNPEKAAIFLNRESKPLLTVLKNGLRLQVPVTAKIGPLRQSARLAIKGKNYFMFFGNPSRMVVSGDKVQVQIGDFKSDELIVE